MELIFRTVILSQVFVALPLSALPRCNYYRAPELPVISNIFPYPRGLGRLERVRLQTGDKKEVAEQCEGQGGRSCSQLHHSSNGTRIPIFFPIYFFFSVPELTAESKKLLRNHLKICSALECWEYPGWRVLCCKISVIQLIDQ